MIFKPYKVSNMSGQTYVNQRGAERDRPMEVLCLDFARTGKQFVVSILIPRVPAKCTYVELDLLKFYFNLQELIQWALRRKSWAATIAITVIPRCMKITLTTSYRLKQWTQNMKAKEDFTLEKDGTVYRVTVVPSRTCLALPSPRTH
jgi:hypothetical protein